MHGKGAVSTFFKTFQRYNIFYVKTRRLRMGKQRQRVTKIPPRTVLKFIRNGRFAKNRVIFLNALGNFTQIPPHKSLFHVALPKTSERCKTIQVNINKTTQLKSSSVTDHYVCRVNLGFFYIPNPVLTITGISHARLHPGTER